MNAPLPTDVRRHTSQFFDREIETLAALAGAIREVAGGDSDDFFGIGDLCHVETETPHRATTADETYYFRCFYDGVALAHLADEPVEIRTESPTGELIEMKPSPDGTIDVRPSDAVMSFGIATDVELSADDTDPAVGQMAEMIMCPYVKAFPTRDAYAYWAEGVDGATVGMSLRDGIALAAALAE